VYWTTGGFVRTTSVEVVLSQAARLGVTQRVARSVGVNP